MSQAPPTERVLLLGREDSIDSEKNFELDDANDHGQSPRSSIVESVRALLPTAVRLPRRVPRRIKRLVGTIQERAAQRPSSHSRYPYPTRLALRRLLFLVRCILGALFLLLVITGIFRPSYTHLPPHYQKLRAVSLQSQDNGRANPLNEKIFITISLFDKGGTLANGAWGESVLDLIDLLGSENVFLSIYENDSGEDGATALMDFKRKVTCQNEIVVEMQAPKDPFPHVTMQDGSQRLKRLTYLSEMRNRALRPLDKAREVVYDKMLFLNDVYFDPVDAAQLLFSTHMGLDGKANYLVACSMDFGNPFKFYDTFATRDHDGYSMGLPFFPVFTSGGRGHSRSDMVDQKDAVRVKSCWSGMVAAQAKYFQSFKPTVPPGFWDIGYHTIAPENPRNISVPIRFRVEPEVYFESCECCLLIADAIRLADRPNAEDDSGVYMNPFVRVAYDAGTISWEPFVRRFERLYSPIHWIVTKIAGMPHFNPYRTVEEGDAFSEEIWVPDWTVPGNGSWQITNRTARNGLYCGIREMLLLSQTPRTRDRNWEDAHVPSGYSLF